MRDRLERGRGTNSVPNKAMILAAGRGSRLGSLSDTTPKCMMLVDGKPVLEQAIECLSRYGVTDLMYSQLYPAGARLDGTYYCLHHPEAPLTEYRVVCDCRKPKPGLLLQAVTELGIDPRMSFMVGDGLTDVQAGDAAGCTSVFLGRQRCDVCRRIVSPGASPGYFASNLLEAVELIRRDVL